MIIYKCSSYLVILVVMNTCCDGRGVVMVAIVVVILVVMREEVELVNWRLCRSCGGVNAGNGLTCLWQC